MDPYGCQPAQGRTDRHGYVYKGGRLAHVVAWEQQHGPVPDGLELEHMCRNPACTALHHLEPVTREENERRKAWKYRAKRKACPQGHPLNVNRVVTRHGGIVCRTCNRQQQGVGDLGM